MLHCKLPWEVFFLSFFLTFPSRGVLSQMRCSVPLQLDVIRMGSEFLSQCEREVNDINLMQQWQIINRVLIWEIMCSGA